MDQILYELIRQCTVKLVLPDESDWGTGFFVAEGTILTCAHVINGYEEQLISVQWQGENLGQAKVIQSFSVPIDLALLSWIERSLSVEHPPCPLLDREFQPFHQLYIYGYPDDHPQGAGVVAQSEGDANDQSIKLIKFQGGQIRPGLSGSPILNKETGKVCGIVSDTRGRSTDLGGLGIPIFEVAKHFPEMEQQNREFYELFSRQRSLIIKPINPFEGEKALYALGFHSGREELLRQLFEELDKGGNRSLVGEARVGKTWLLKQICQNGHVKMKRKVDGFIYLDMRSIEDGKDFFDALCFKLNISPSIRGYKLSQALVNKQYVLCLDEIDQLADDQRFTKSQRDQLYSLCDGEDMPFSLVISSQAPLKQLFPDSPLRSSPLVGICQQIDVKPISFLQAQEFIEDCLRGTGLEFSTSEVQQLHRKCGGKPKLLLDFASAYYREIRSSRTAL